MYYGTLASWAIHCMLGYYDEPVFRIPYESKSIISVPISPRVSQRYKKVAACPGR